MRSVSFFILLLCKTLLDNSYVAAEGFDDPDTGNYDMFMTDDFGDQLAQSDFLPSDPLAQSDVSLFINPFSSNDISTSFLSSSDLIADLPTDDCSSSDSTQDQFFGKRLDTGSDAKTQMCLPQRDNPGKYPGFDPENDPLIPVKIKEPEDEEFCPRQLYFPSYLVCDSGYFVDRKINLLTGLWNLNRCQRSTILATSSSRALISKLLTVI